MLTKEVKLWLNEGHAFEMANISGGNIYSTEIILAELERIEMLIDSAEAKLGKVKTHKQKRSCGFDSIDSVTTTVHKSHLVKKYGDPQGDRIFKVTYGLLSHAFYNWKVLLVAIVVLVLILIILLVNLLFIR